MTDKKYIGIREIAKIAGVSIATVSRVINAPETTSRSTREKVLNIIKKYNYVPNQTAKNFFSGTSNSIAIFVFDIDNPFNTRIIKNLNKIAFENNFTLLVCETEDNHQQAQKYYDYCKSIRTSGIIFTEGALRDIFLEENTDMTLVLMDRGGLHHSNYYTVKSNHKQSLQLIVDYLYRLNHRKIGFISGLLDMLSAQERLDGYLESMKHHHLPIPSNYIYNGEYSFTSGMAAFDYFYSLPDSPTAVIASNDQIAQGFVMKALSLGVKIPNEYSVCGIDAVSENTFYPPVTSAKQDTVALSQTMFDIVKNTHDTKFSSETIIDVSIAMGQTCSKI